MRPSGRAHHGPAYLSLAVLRVALPAHSGAQWLLTTESHRQLFSAICFICGGFTSSCGLPLNSQGALRSPDRECFSIPSRRTKLLYSHPPKGPYWGGGRKYILPRSPARAWKAQSLPQLHHCAQHCFSDKCSVPFRVRGLTPISLETQVMTFQSIGKRQESSTVIRRGVCLASGTFSEK